MSIGKLIEHSIEILSRAFAILDGSLADNINTSRGWILRTVQ